MVSGLNPGMFRRTSNLAISRETIVLDLILAAFGGVLLFLVATWHIEFASINGEITPAFPDSFYHAMRILDSVKNGGVIQFDKGFHAPDGAWVTWPWGYDWLVARIVNLGTEITGITAIEVLVYVPPLWGGVNLFLITLLAKSLSLELRYRLIIVIVFALLPLNQQLHLIGRVDHHFMELTMALLSALLSVKWFDRQRKRDAISLACVLGVAMAIHNELFILQLPVVVSLAALWLAARPLPKTTPHFAVALVFFTLLFLLPAETFHEGFFAYYYHSSFHLYIASCSALFSLYVYRFAIATKSFIFGIFASLVIAVPVLMLFSSGYGFISGQWEHLRSISEVRSLFSINPDQRFSWREAISSYSGFIIFAPISLLYLYYLAIKWQRPQYYYLAAMTTVAFFFLFNQVRFHYLGSFMLFIPVAMFFQDFALLQVQQRLRFGLFVVAALISFALPIGTLFKRQSGSPSFEATYYASSVLQQQCLADPGIILAPPEVGHYLRYFTSCAVLANSFIMTPEDFRFWDLSSQYFNMGAAALAEQAPHLKYVYLLRKDNVFVSMDDADIKAINPLLIRELLIAATIPEQYETLFEVAHKSAGSETVFARVLKIHH